MGAEHEEIETGAMGEAVRIDYADAKAVLARTIAEERGEPVAAKHANEATRLLWPYLSDEDRSKLVLR